jgi:glycosyltransferase involved in cell wall biosynthesis
MVEAYLEECLDSVINQTYKNLEIILIDDGSSDSCGIICDSYARKDERVKVVHQDNSGLAAARNAGMDIMTGSYFAFVDSDDILHPKYIETLYSLISKYNTDLSMCEISIFSEGESHHFSYETDSESILIMNEDEFAYGFLCDYTMPYSVSWNKLYKKDKFDNLRFKNVKFEDSYFLADYLLLGVSCVKTNKHLYLYRKRSNSISSQRDIKYYYDSIHVSIDQFDILKDRYGSDFRTKFFCGILKRISRLAADIYWNRSKEDAKKFYDVWIKFYAQNRITIPNKKENIKILIYRYSPILYYHLVKDQIYTVFDT